jgi:hypothetical protein
VSAAELLPMRSLLEAATQTSIEIDHPYYPADNSIRGRQRTFSVKAVSLVEAVKL